MRTRGWAIYVRGLAQRFPMWVKRGDTRYNPNHRPVSFVVDECQNFPL